MKQTVCIEATRVFEDKRKKFNIEVSIDSFMSEIELESELTQLLRRGNMEGVADLLNGKDYGLCDGVGPYDSVDFEDIVVRVFEDEASEEAE